MTRKTSQRFRSAAFTASAATLLVVGVAAPASAAISVMGSFVQGDGANDFITVSCVGGVLDASGTTGDPCAPMSSLYVDPGPGADSVDLSGVTGAAFPALTSVSAHASDASADTVTGSPLDDYLTGDYTDTLSGAGGNDMISGANTATGGSGDDSFMEINTFASGGGGDDRFIQFAPSAGLDGGVGVDSWELDFDQSTLGVGSTVDFTMSESGLTLDVADDMSPALSVSATNLEQVFFTLLRQGSQTYTGSTFPGSQHVRGMAGPDAIVGGAADDALYGGSGNDSVTGGAGADVLHGGEDNDSIQARDGVADKIDCGAGTDSVVADAVDVVVNCETVDQPAPTPPTAPPAQVVLVPFAPVTNAVTGPAKVKKGKTGSFAFSSPTAGATFQCQLDNGAWKTCASAYKVKTKKLKLGKHTLQVRALVSGAADATPSKKVFKVVKG